MTPPSIRATVIQVIQDSDVKRKGTNLCLSKILLVVQSTLVYLVDIVSPSMMNTLVFVPRDEEDPDANIYFRKRSAMVVITMLFAFTTSVHAGQDILETEKYVIHKIPIVTQILAKTVELAMSQDLPTLVISIGGASAQKDTMGHTATSLIHALISSATMVEDVR